VRSKQLPTQHLGLQSFQVGRVGRMADTKKTTDPDVTFKQPGGETVNLPARRVVVTLECNVPVGTSDADIVSAFIFEPKLWVQGHGDLFLDAVGKVTG
jgi:hypothetical protein